MVRANKYAILTAIVFHELSNRYVIQRAIQHRRKQFFDELPDFDLLVRWNRGRGALGVIWVWKSNTKISLTKSYVSIVTDNIPVAVNPRRPSLFKFTGPGFCNRLVSWPSNHSPAFCWITRLEWQFWHSQMPIAGIHSQHCFPSLRHTSRSQPRHVAKLLVWESINKHDRWAAFANYLPVCVLDFNVGVTHVACNIWLPDFRATPLAEFAGNEKRKHLSIIGRNTFRKFDFALI